MMNESNVIDVSGFFLFEATGDSSEIQSPVMNEDSTAATADHHHHQWSDDDAQSCSGRLFVEVDDAGEGDEIINKCDSSCLSFEENNEYDDDAAGGGNETDGDDDDDEEEEVNQGWIMSHVKRKGSKIRPLGVRRMMKSSKKSKGCKLEMMSEKERDRLFWEACLSQ